MSSSKGLLIAVDLASSVRDAARQTLRDAQAVAAAAAAQLEQLQIYARDTDQRWGKQSQSLLLPEVMHHHYQFMARLGHAIELQTTVATDQAGRVQVCQQQLLQAELRLTSLKKVTERRAVEVDRVQARREQKQIDELASIKYLQAARPFDQG